MMMVDTELRPSAIHGIGVFLLQPVRKGDLIWRFDSRIDRIYSDAELAELPAGLQRFLQVYSTRHDALRLWVLCGDNGRHFNHSDAPNTASLGIAFGDDVAAADLPAGTELTSDYRTICDAMREEMSFPSLAAVDPAPADEFSQIAPHQSLADI
jgi:SET domain-containing protein